MALDELIAAAEQSLPRCRPPLFLSAADAARAELDGLITRVSYRVDELSTDALLSRAEAALAAASPEERGTALTDRVQENLAAEGVGRAEELLARLRSARAAIDAAEAEHFDGWRQRIASGAVSHAEVFAELCRHMREGRDRQRDDADLFFERLVGAGSAIVAERPAYHVTLVPTPVRTALKTARLLELGAGDVFWDIGAGRGLLALVAKLAAPEATVCGIEYQEAYHREACAHAQTLRLDVRFVRADAVTWDYGDANAFYLYLPVHGPLIRLLLDRLREQAKRRPLRIVTLGPMAPHFFAEPWLRGPAPDSGPDKLWRYDSV